MASEAKGRGFDPRQPHQSSVFAESSTHSRVPCLVMAMVLKTYVPVLRQESLNPSIEPLCLNRALSEPYRVRGFSAPAPRLPTRTMRRRFPLAVIFGSALLEAVA